MTGVLVSRFPMLIDVLTVLQLKLVGYYLRIVLPVSISCLCKTFQIFRLGVLGSTEPLSLRPCSKTTVHGYMATALQCLPPYSSAFADIHFVYPQRMVRLTFRPIFTPMCHGRGKSFTPVTGILIM